MHRNNLVEFRNHISGVFVLDKMPGLSLVQMINFLPREDRELLRRRESDFLTCDGDLDHVNMVHENIYRELRTAHGEEDFLGGTPEQEPKEEKIRERLFAKLKDKIIEFIEFEIAYISGVLKYPILYEVDSLGDELVRLIKNENDDFHEVYLTYSAWFLFCQDYIRLSSYWEFTGALLFGHAQKDQFRLFLYKTQGVWVEDDVSSYSARNSDQFQSEHARKRKAKHFILRYFV